jgi:hypothetical protein
MKTAFFFRYALLLLLPLVLFSCTMEKRHYRSGWYISGIDLKKHAEPNTIAAAPKIETVAPSETVPAIAVAEKPPGEPLPAKAEIKQASPARKIIPATAAAEKHEAKAVIKKKTSKSLVAPAKNNWKDEQRSKYFGIGSGILFVAGLVAMALFAPVSLFVALFAAAFVTLVLHLSMRVPKEHPQPVPEESKKKKGNDGTNYAIIFLGIWLLAALIFIGGIVVFLCMIAASF